MTTCKLAFTIESSSSDLNVVVRVDNTIVFRGPVIDVSNITHNINDSEGNHCLAIELLNKTTDHTKIDAQGNILKDEIVKCSNFTVDGVNIDHTVYSLATYTHNFNGTGDQIVEKFYGTLGCNGTVRLEFTTPIYVWLLEHI
jgi:hypothetical protein